MQINNRKQFEFKSGMNFGAGWNKKIAAEIQHCDVVQIAKRFAERGIETDFKGNKVVAWCCEKTADIFQQLNEHHKIKLALPKGIFVEDFSKIEAANNGMFSFCNWFQDSLVTGNLRVFPERTLFFNSNLPWENIDNITEEQHEVGFWAHNHFLTNFFHEFAHAAHDGYLLERFNPEKLRTKLEGITSGEYIEKYQRRFQKLVGGISTRALASPLETVAEDIAGRISGALNPLNPVLISNPFSESPYAGRSLMPLFKPKTEKDNLLKRAWNINL